MGMFEKYATKSDVAEYIGQTVDDLPNDIEVYISRASEMVCIAIRKNYNPNNAEHVEAAMLATCAQCKEWIDRGSTTVVDSDIASYSIGDLSVTYATNNSESTTAKTSTLNSDAIRYLNYKHLLYKGMR